MPISEINALLRSKDESDNDKLIYPITKADNVDGLEDALSGKVDKVSGKGLSSNDYTTTDKNKVNAIPDDPKYTDTVYDDSELRGIVNEITSVPHKQMFFAITEDIVTITKDPTKGVAPYSSSYGMTYIQVDKDAGIEWIEGAYYTFVCNTKLVVSSTYRNVAIRIGGDTDGDVWHPLASSTSGSVIAGSSYILKAYTTLFQYKSTYLSYGALHLQTDNNSNTTYPYLVNTVAGDATGSYVKIDDNGYGARYSLLFPTIPISESIENERYSSLFNSSSTATTKVAVVPTSGKFYIDRHPLTAWSGNVSAGSMANFVMYQDYTGLDLRYNANTSNTWVSPRSKAFLWLKNFDVETMSFESDATVGNIMTINKIKTRFPNTTEGDVYLCLLGYTGTTWYSCTPPFTQRNIVYKYTPSTEAFEEVTLIKKSDMANLGATKLFYSSQEPSELRPNDVWFQIL